MFRRLFRDRSFLAALALFALVGGHLVAGVAARDRQESTLDHSPECHVAATALLDDRRMLPAAPAAFLQTVDPAMVEPVAPVSGPYPIETDPIPRVTRHEFEAALAGPADRSPSARLEAIERYIADLERVEGLLPAYGALERSRPVIEDLSPLEPVRAFALHARLGVFRERVGADRAAVDAYRSALRLEPAGAVTDERVFVRWRTAALIQGRAKAAAIDALAEASGLMNAQIALPGCITERRASLVWEMSRLYEALGLRREAGALRDGLALRQAAQPRTDAI